MKSEVRSIGINATKNFSSVAPQHQDEFNKKAQETATKFMSAFKKSPTPSGSYLGAKEVQKPFVNNINKTTNTSLDEKLKTSRK